MSSKATPTFALGLHGMCPFYSYLALGPLWLFAVRLTFLTPAEPSHRPGVLGQGDSVHLQPASFARLNG